MVIKYSITEGQAPKEVKLNGVGAEVEKDLKYLRSTACEKERDESRGKPHFG